MRIAVLCLPGIGDALMATPMIKVLRKNYPHAQIDIICMFGGVEYIFKNNPYINNIYLLSLYKQNPLKALKRIIALRKNAYDISILAFPAYRREYHIVSWLIGAKKRVAHQFAKGYWKESNFLNTNLVAVDETVHNVINNLNLLRAVDINWKKYLNERNISYDLHLERSDILFGEKYIHSLKWNKKNIVIIHPGSIDSPAGMLKRWPKEFFISLAKNLIKRKKNILIFVGPFEVELGNEIVSSVASNRCVLVKSTFSKSVGILNVCPLLISNDNGFAHLANALKIKEIVLFGPTNPEWCAPYNKKYSTVLRKATFTPWFRNDMKVTHPPQNAQSGMEKISVQAVLHAIKNDK